MRPIIGVHCAGWSNHTFFSNGRLTSPHSLRPEERLLVRHIRRINARDRALISGQLLLGFRISEVHVLIIGHVWDGTAARGNGFLELLLKGTGSTVR
jgi:hypothetical protein